MQWSRLEPLLPRGEKPGRPPTWSRRQLIDGIRWWTRTGTPWRDVPEWYGPWNRVYELFRRWQHGGIWKRILGQLQVEADMKGLITWDVSVDSTVCRAHQHAAGARKKGICSVSRPVGSTSSPTIMGLDGPHFQPVLEQIRVPRRGPGRPRTTPDKVRADKAHGSRGGRPAKFDKVDYRERHAVECGKIGCGVSVRSV